MSKAISTKTRQNSMLEALRSTLGVVTSACKISGVPRSTHYTWILTDEWYKEEVEAISEEAIDFVESSLFLQIKGKSTAATIFYLKTKGKNRGYVERQEVIVNQAQLSEEELAKEIERLQKRIKDAE